MNTWAGVALTLLSEVACGFLGWEIQKTRSIREIRRLKEQISTIQSGEKAAKFRVRTEGGEDSKKRSTVRKARLRAIIYRTPPPRG